MQENKDNQYTKVTVCSHPLVQVPVSDIRNKNTNSLRFRRLLKEISRHIVYEALADTPLNQIKVETPLSLADGVEFKHNNFILVPILRAGLSLIDGALETLPFAQVRHIGLYRDENTLQPVEYYVKLPDQIDPEATVIIMDPMLATGGSAISAVDVFKKRGVKKIKFICIIASEYGIKALTREHPDIQVYTAVIDPELNEQGYIVPGLGDAGDRCFGT